MKKLFTLLLLSMFLMLGTGSAWAASRTYDGKEKFYFDADGADIDWEGSSAILKVLFKNTSTSTESGWLTASVQTCRTGYSKVYCVTVPSGTYNKIILSRNNPSGGAIWNQTQDQEIDATSNYITKFYNQGTVAEWGTFDEKATGWKLFVSHEDDDDFSYSAEFMRASVGDVASTVSITMRSSGGDDILNDLTTYYQFYISDKDNVTSGTYYKNNGSIKHNAYSWEFNTSDNNCKLYPMKAGTYTFTLNWDNGTPKVSVAYPAGSSFSTEKFKKPDGWSTVYAYVWSGDGNSSFPTKREDLGGWPGTEAAYNSSTSLYEIGHSYDVTPEHIIWNNGNNGSETSAFDFVADVSYNQYGQIYSVTFTPNGYATFYSENYKVQLPSGVTACTGQYHDGWLTLSPLTGDYASIVPANVPVVLKGSGSATLEATNSENVAGYTANVNFVGTDVDLSTPLYAYVLGYQNSTTAFYHFTGDIIPANRAYVQLESALTAPGVRIVEGENNATSVENIEASEETVKFFENGELRIRRNGVTYDAVGRQVK